MQPSRFYFPQKNITLAKTKFSQKPKTYSPVNKTLKITSQIRKGETVGIKE